MIGQKEVRVEVNRDAKDAVGNSFSQNFALVKDRLGDTLHMHELKDSEFPYELQWSLLIARVVGRLVLRREFREGARPRAGARPQRLDFVNWAGASPHP